MRGFARFLAPGRIESHDRRQNGRAFSRSTIVEMVTGGPADCI
jgi:hypothetical protein